MSIAVAERLKSELTDRFVVVTKGVPELRRFQGLTGTVKTVNMNGRALVQFDGPEDISWYDIDPTYLVVVDAPVAKPKSEPAESKPAEKKAAAKPAAPAGKSPLEMARAQGSGTDAPASAAKPLSPLEQARAQGGGGSAPGAPAAAPEKKALSPLELARQQGAAKESTPPADAPAESTPEAETPAVDVSKLSPLERARLEGSKLK